MRVILLNLIIKVKGIVNMKLIIFKFSIDQFFKGFYLSRDLSKSDQQFEDINSLCETEDKTPKVMINVIKESENGKADIDAYAQKVIFELFPVIESSVFYAGVPLSDGWSQVGQPEVTFVKKAMIDYELLSLKHSPDIRGN